MFLAVNISYGQDSLIAEILKKGGPLVQEVLAAPANYEVQIMYSQISRNEQGVPRLKTYKFQIDEERYFYPASTVKMPVACFALEKLNELNIDQLSDRTPIAFGAASPPQYKVLSDTTAEDGVLTLRHLIKKVFLVSDNEAYNLLYAFCGQEDINSRMRAKGYRHAKITHRVGAGAYSMKDNRMSNPYLFYNENNILLLSPSTYNFIEYDDVMVSNCLKGAGYISSGRLINEPFNFCEKNFLSLPSLHDMVAAIVIPETMSEEKQFHLTAEQRRDLLSFMSERPRESKFPDYDEEVYDSSVKFLMVGDQKDLMPKRLRIFNKVGAAYGYLTDAAYIVDLERNIEFILAATIHVNDNAIYNDDTYQYDEVGIPFLAEVGRLFYAHELSGNHTFDFQELRTLTYD